MKIFVIGLNHKTANVEIREKLAFNGPKLEEGVFGLAKVPGVKEIALLSTCNRVEIYACVSDSASASEGNGEVPDRLRPVAVGDFVCAVCSPRDSLPAAGRCGRRIGLPFEICGS